MTRLSTVLATVLIAGCSTAPPVHQSFPDAADLAVQPKPQAPVDIITSDAAADAHDIAIEGWGEEGWRQVARVCRWAVERGAKLPFNCPPPDS